MRNARVPLLAAVLGAAIAVVSSTPIAAAAAPCSGGVVALRFDDGPYYPETNDILDALQQYHLKATFFVIGSQVQENPAIVQRMIREGHEIANHTWSHPPLADLTPAEVAQELKSTQDIVKQVTGFTPRYAGPPYGSSSNMVRQEMAKLGLREVLKSWDSGDWDGAENWMVINQLTLTPPGGIFLLHDWSPVARDVIPSIAWYFNEYWAAAPICSGRIITTTKVNPVLDWLGQYYFAEAAPW
jgi:peptidoglycan/xylan/chitin deacetylase (PgdA/CDA1 family)